MVEESVEQTSQIDAQSSLSKDVDVSEEDISSDAMDYDEDPNGELMSDISVNEEAEESKTIIYRVESVVVQSTECNISPIPSENNLESAEFTSANANDNDDDTCADNSVDEAIEESNVTNNAI